MINTVALYPESAGVTSDNYERGNAQPHKLKPPY